MLLLNLTAYRLKSMLPANEDFAAPANHYAAADADRSDVPGLQIDIDIDV